MEPEAQGWISYKDFYSYAESVFFIKSMTRNSNYFIGTGFLSKIKKDGHPFNDTLGIFTAYHVFDPEYEYLNMINANQSDMEKKNNIIFERIINLHINFYNSENNSMSESAYPLVNLLKSNSKYGIDTSLDFVFFEIREDFKNYPPHFVKSGIPCNGVTPVQNQLTIVIQYPQILSGVIGFDVGTMRSSKIINDNKPLVTYEVSTTHGSSGSPVLQYTESGTLEVVALHLNGFSNQENYNYGRPLSVILNLDEFPENYGEIRVENKSAQQEVTVDVLEEHIGKLQLEEDNTCTSSSETYLPLSQASHSIKLLQTNSDKKIEYGLRLDSPTLISESLMIRVIGKKQIISLINYIECINSICKIYIESRFVSKIGFIANINTINCTSRGIVIMGIKNLNLEKVQIKFNGHSHLFNLTEICKLNDQISFCFLEKAHFFEIVPGNLPQYCQKIKGIPIAPFPTMEVDAICLTIHREDDINMRTVLLCTNKDRSKNNLSMLSMDHDQFYTRPELNWIRQEKNQRMCILQMLKTKNDFPLQAVGVVGKRNIVKSIRPIGKIIIGQCFSAVYFKFNKYSSLYFTVYQIVCLL